LIVIYETHRSFFFFLKVLPSFLVVLILSVEARKEDPWRNIVWLDYSELPERVVGTGYELRVGARGCGKDPKTFLVVIGSRIQG
jgi:hypothetical protein